MDHTAETTEIPADEEKAPSLEGLPKPVVTYVRTLESRIESLVAELAAAPAPFPRGVASSDVYFFVADAATGNMKIVFTDHLIANSSVDLIEAHRSLRLARKVALGLGYAANLPAHVRPAFPDGLQPPDEPQEHDAPPTTGRRAPNATRPVTPSRSAPPSGRSGPQPRQETSSEGTDPNGDKWFKVLKVWPDKSDKGGMFLQVILDTPRFKQHGLRAYLDSCELPSDLIEFLEDGRWQLKDAVDGYRLQSEYYDLSEALTSPDAKKIVAFRTPQ